MFRIEHFPVWGRKAEALVDDSRLSMISDAAGESKVKRIGRHWGRKFQEQGVSASPCSWKRNQTEGFDVGCSVVRIERNRHTRVKGTNNG